MQNPAFTLIFLISLQCIPLDMLAHEGGDVTRHLMNPFEEAPKSSDSDPCNPYVQNSNPALWKLISAGLAMTSGQLVLNDVMHEGAHSLVATILGGDVIEFYPFPTRHGSGRVTFGHMRYDAPKGFENWKRTAIGLAPTTMNLAFLGAYGAVVWTGTLPADQYAQLGLLIFNGAQLIDFMMHIWSKDPLSDVPRALEEAGIAGTPAAGALYAFYTIQAIGGAATLLKAVVDLALQRRGKKRYSMWDDERKRRVTNDPRSPYGSNPAPTVTIKPLINVGPQGANAGLEVTF